MRSLVAAMALCAVTSRIHAAELGVSPGVWLDVPYVRQEKIGCGSASLAMLLAYWRPAASEIGNDARRIQRELYSSAEQGIPASSMRNYLEGQGFAAFAFAGTWADL